MGQKRKQDIVKEKVRDAAPWAVLAVMLLLYYLRVNINYGDDIEFVKALDH